MIFNSSKSKFDPTRQDQGGSSRNSGISASQLRSKNLALYIVSALIAVYDVAAMAFMVVQGYGAASISLAALLLALDAGHIALATVTNYRYSYAKWELAGYILLSAAFTAGILADGFDVIGSVYVFSAAGFALALLTRAVMCSLLISAAGYAGGRDRKSLAIVTVAIGIAMLAGALGGNAVMGYYGQDTTARAVEYTRNVDENGGISYVATSVLPGKGSRVEIKEFFNGERVDAIDCGIFNAAGVTRFQFESEKAPVFINTEALILSKLTGNRLIEVPKGAVDDYKDAAYAAGGGTAEVSVYRDKLAAAIVPKVRQDEVYVAFRYDTSSLPSSLLGRDSFIDTFIAPKGATFSAEHMGRYASLYAQRNDLEWNYANNERLHMAELLIGNSLLVGGRVTESAIVEVSFSPVYRISIGKGAYDYPVEGWKNTAYISEENRLELSLATSRPGCYADWVAAAADASAYVTDVDDVLEFAMLHGDTTLTPMWRVILPGLTGFGPEKKEYVYGDSVSLRAAAKAHPLPLTYTLYAPDGRLIVENVSSAQFDLGILDPLSGTYRITVRATDLYDDRLFSEYIQSAQVIVRKKALTFTVTPPPDLVYSASDKAIGYGFDRSQLVGDDSVDYSPALTVVKDAGVYTLPVSLTGADASKYTVTPLPAITILPYSLEVSWSGTRRTYNGGAQAPNASVSPLEGDTVNLTVDSNVNAGTYTVGVRTNNGNYTLANASVEFIIEPMRATVAWSGESFVYNGKAQSPSASFTDIRGLTVALSVAGAETDAGSYTAYASTTDGNYKLLGAEFQFAITPKPVSVVWSGDALVYNGKEQKPSAGFKNVAGETIELVVTVGGGGVNAGTYTATTAYSDPNYTLQGTAKEYTIAPKIAAAVWTNTTLIFNGKAQKPSASIRLVDGTAFALEVTDAHTDAGSYPVSAAIGVAAVASNYTLTEAYGTLTITPKQVDVVWRGLNDAVYDGEAYAPTASFKDVANADVSLSVTGAQTDAGSHRADASTDDGNYALRNASTTFVIAPKAVTAVWSDLTFTYDGAAHKPSAYFVDVSSARVALTVSGERTDAGTYNAVASGGGKNYTLTNPEAEFVILPLQRAVNWSPLSFTFNGKPQRPAATYSDIQGNAVTVEPYTDGAVNAGTHTAAVTAGQGNYVLTGTGCEFTIAAAPAAVVWSDTEKTYNGARQLPSASFVDVDGKSVALGLSLLNDSDGTNAGTHSVAVTGFDDVNYLLTGLTASYEIAPMPARVEWRGGPFSYTGEPQLPSAALRDLSGNLIMTLEVELAEGNGTDPGEHTARIAAFDGQGNYSIPNATFAYAVTEPQAEV